MCEEGAQRDCGTQVGACRLGKETCRNNAWSECEGGQSPQNEQCDGLDNNCDGDIDNGEVCQAGAFCAGASGCQVRVCEDGEERPCGIDEGVCRIGIQTCSDNAWGACRGQILPAGEACDGADNDCDGVIDNGDLCPTDFRCDGANGCVAIGCDAGEQRRPCGSDTGSCQQGVQTCVENGWGACEGEISPIRKCATVLIMIVMAPSITGICAAPIRYAEVLMDAWPRFATKEQPEPVGLTWFVQSWDRAPPRQCVDSLRGQSGCGCRGV